MVIINVVRRVLDLAYPDGSVGNQSMEFKIREADNSAQLLLGA